MDDIEAKRLERQKKRIQAEADEAARAAQRQKKTLDEAILFKAVDKAIGNGWTYGEGVEYGEIGAGGIRVVTRTRGIVNGEPFTYIFRYDFAKALWPGPSKVNTYSFNENTKETDGVNVPLWQYHLQQMVIADDPIKYLGENI